MNAFKKAVCLGLVLVLALLAQNPVVRSASSPTDDTILVGNGTEFQGKAVPNCPDTGGNHLNYTASTNTVSCGTSGGAGGSADPLDMTVAYVREEFPNTVSTANQIGTHGWASACTGGTVAHQPTTVPSFGLVRLTTGATSTNLCTIHMGFNSTTSSSFGSLNGYTFDSRYRFRQPIAESTSLRLYVGWLAGTSTTFSNGCYARFDTTLADTTWKVVCDNSGSTNVFDTAVAPDTSYHTLRVRSSVAGTLLIQFDATTEQSFSTNLPTASNQLKPQFYVETATAAARNFEAEFFGWSTSGLSR